MKAVAPRLLDWQREHGRNDLPWQHPRSAYRVWLSEIMLQQTQVATVIPYFQRFVEALPDLSALASASEDEVLALWSGLGYYRRARFLHAAAKQAAALHGGELPADFDALLALPGIGRSTAGAILAQAYGLPYPIMDGNVKRVLARYHGIIGYPGLGPIEKQLWLHAEQHMPRSETARYTQAIMDLGAMVCRRSQPDCPACPLQSDCVAYRDGLTDSLPSPRPAKTLPTRQTVMMVIRDHHHRYLLERRPVDGIWPGLWSLPEASDPGAAWQVAGRYARLDDALALDSFDHIFSHYRLRIEPLLFAGVRAIPAVAEHSQHRWYPHDELLRLGLPAPVRQLLQRCKDLTP
ncbi:A/G-specific adenine glycosylase [Frateuria aurantia]